MPELPDLERFRTYLNATALHETVKRVRVPDTRVLENVSAPELDRSLRNREMETVDRHGKFLFVRCQDGKRRGGIDLALHFGMTGELAYYKDDESAPEHPRVVFDLASGYCLAYDCPRMLGRVRLVKDRDAFLRAHEVGPDAMEIGEGAFREGLGRYRGGLKSFLMDQSRQAGIGNVYADEILFHARLSPKAKAMRLSRAEARRLYRSMRRVLSLASERKGRRERFPRTWITPRRRRDDPQCPRGCGSVQVGRVNGRTTYWCPGCQEH